MVLELDIGRCANEDVGPPREWIVRSDIGWREERSMNVKPLPSRHILKS